MAEADLFSDIITLQEMIAEATRELDLRLSVYPRRVAANKMTQRRADRQIAVQLAIVTTLKSWNDVSDRYEALLNQLGATDA